MHISFQILKIAFGKIEVEYTKFLGIQLEFLDWSVPIISTKNV